MRDRDLLVRVRAALAATFTTAGHKAITVEYESMGGCGWRGCSPSCTEQRALFLALDALVERETATQPALFEVAG